MPHDFLHNHAQFADLIRIVADARGIVPALVEKDYWIMQSLYGLQQLGMSFQLKGGRSLSKGHGVIHRFSEDIDIRIEPPRAANVMAGKNHTKPAHIESRRAFFDNGPAQSRSTGFRRSSATSPSTTSRALATAGCA
jgi:hypothetical protein